MSHDAAVSMRLPRGRARAILLVLLGIGALFRLQGLRWDEGHHLHPDERFISMVEEKVHFPKSLAEYFDSSRSSLNPYNKGEGSFVYGSLPLVLAKAIAPLFGQPGYDLTYRVGRGLSAVFDLVTIWLVYRLTRRFAGRRASLFAAGLSAFCVLGIQLSHFWAVDTFLTTFTAAALLGAVRIAQDRSGLRGDLATGVAAGLAVACKITALSLLLPLGAALLIRALHRGDPPFRSLVRALPRALVVLLAIAATVRVALPYAFLGPSPFSFRLDPRWVKDLKTLAALSRSVASFPPAFQWAGRSVFFPLENFLLWGAGVFFGLSALVAAAWGAVMVWKRRALALAPVLLHALVIVAYHGLTMVKSIRYFYPAYPDFAVLTGVFFSALLTRLPLPRLTRAAAVAVLGGTFLWAVAFTAIYRRPQTRVAATHWIYTHVPAGQRFASEAWDDGIPLPERGYDPGQYAGPSLPLVDPDSAAKASMLVQALEKTNGIAVTSGRTYANVTRIPAVFPMTIAYYRALFDGRLGFERIADFTSYPSLGPIRFPDDRAEEQFTVYDHPRVLLFRKTPRFSAAAARGLLLAAVGQTPPSMGEWERWPRSLKRVTEPVRPDRSAEPEEAPSVEPGQDDSVGAAVVWYLAVLLVGVAAAPICWTVFPRLADRGLGFARIFGLVLATYLLTLLLSFHWLPNGRRAAGTSLLAVAVVSAILFLRQRSDLVRFLRANRRTLLWSEAAFAVGFLLFLGIRALNPEIYWGEKPMDFSILNILVRTRSLPASDPWFAGAPLGYYTFGHEMIVFLTLLAKLSTRFTFNLAFGLLGGTILQGAFTLARNWTGSVRSGIAGGALMVLIGNLSGLREWLVRKRHLDWDYFWATSRVIKDTINEYPLWSLLFADLHAHVLAIPIFLLFAGAALHFVRLHAEPVAPGPRRLGAAVLLGFLAAAGGLTNAWDVPLLLGLLVLVPLTTIFVGRRMTLPAIRRAAIGLFVAVGSAFLLARPLWVRVGGAPGIGRNAEPPGRGIDVLTVFGLFFFLAVAWWLAAVSRRLADRGVGPAARWILVLLASAALAFSGVRFPNLFLACGVLLFTIAVFTLAETTEERLALGFLASAFVLVLFCQRFYIYDRMNTFFKLYLEAWLLFAIATAVLVFRPRKHPGAFGTWALPARLGFFVLLAGALFTGVTAARGALSRHTAPYSGPSLDGLRYLETLRPGEYRAVLWLRRTLRGTPVLLEAQGPSYQDFSRISMLTGLPTVLGWDYHVKQRGNPEREIQARSEAVRAIYASPEAANVVRLLRRYRVGYVYVGWLERKTYPVLGLRKFRTAKEVFELAYENPETQIYRVAGGDAQDLLVPAKEEIASPPTAGEVVEPEEKPSVSATAAPGEAPWAGLKEPRGAALDDRGRLWVADFGHSRLRVFDSDGGYLGGWGGRGAGEFGFRELCGVAIRGDNLYVADTWNGRVQAYTTAGILRATAGELYGPRGIAVAPIGGRVWVSDTGNHRVVSYDALLQDLEVIGQRGKGPGEFSSPIGIAAGPSGAIYVADAGNRRIQVLSAEGKPMRSFAFLGWGDGAEPFLAVDHDETLFVSDPAASRVLALQPSGAMKIRYETDSDGRTLDRPTGLALDSKNRILYVVNSGNNTVSKIRLSERRTP